MQVQTAYSVLSSREALPKQKGQAAGTPAGSATPVASSATTVTISRTAQALASQATSDPSLQSRAQTIQAAKDDPAFAKKWAEEFAYDDSYEKCGPLVDISNWPMVRYAATGEGVTEESLAAFKAEAAKVTAGRIALYQAEKAKGTSDVQILEKLYAYVDGQSDDYLSKLGWTRMPQQSASENAGSQETHSR